MIEIINNQNFSLPTNKQQVISNAASKMGLDKVIVGEIDYSEKEPFVPIYFESEDNGELIDEFAFNLCLTTNKIF